ncbi:MAG TPA: serine hydrolase domain-containing protein [Steroidobacteraceae bacterium]|nr:serine hydrolase domain-containing protein [Steroidobacteraceae bacterium]
MSAIAVLFCTAGAAAAAGSAAIMPLPRAAPESVGLSAARLRTMSEFFRIEASRHTAPGYVLMVARGGKLVAASAVGYRNIAQRLPMTLDTRFRIASMSKPITAVAVLMLYEEGRFQLDDPLARFLPEFAHPQVFTGVGAKGEITTEPATRDITIRDLLTQTSGLGYLPGFDTKTPLAKVYGALKLDPHASLADTVRRIAAMPLYFQPGQGWRYSYADDVLGRLVEVVSGMPLPQFLSERIFSPLKMNATGFYLPPSTAPMLATMYKPDGEGGLTVSHANWITDPTDAKLWPSGVGVEIDALHAPQADFNGDYSWGGIFGTEWLASPRTGIVAVLMTQIDPTGNSIRLRTDVDFQNLLFAAVRDLGPPTPGGEAR